MNKLLVWTILLCTACQGPPPSTHAATGALIGSGRAPSPDGDCDCPPGTEPGVNDEGQRVCVAPECTVASDCGAREICAEGTCEPVPCSLDDPCADPLVCVEGACVEPACDHCPSGYHCVLGQFPEGDHVCVVDTCTGGADCPAGMVCAGGACVDDPVLCDGDGECPSGRCTMLPEPSTVGVCVPFGGCLADAACPTGERCEDGVCTTSPPPCTSDESCPDGRCDVATGTCLAAGGCIDSDGCPDGQQCLAGICGVPEGCAFDEQCGEELRCIEGRCTDCSSGGCEEAPPGPDAGPSGPDAGPPGPDAGLPGPDAGLPGPDAGLPGPDASPPPDGDPSDHHGPFGCPSSCSGRLGYTLLCPMPPLNTQDSWCPPSPSCGAMDACQAAQIAECSSWCPVACVVMFNRGPTCCDCGAGGHAQGSLEVAP